jgi:hypothetical protein
VNTLAEIAAPCVLVLPLVILYVLDRPNRKEGQ